MAIFIVSDLHLGHSKDFIYRARGFESVEDMNEAIIRNWNEVVDEDDDVYILGDLVMGPEINLQMGLLYEYARTNSPNISSMASQHRRAL